MVAILCREAACQRILNKIASAPFLLIGAPTVLETQLALTIKLNRDAGALVDQFLSETQVEVIPFGREHVAVFFEAFLRFGKGRHPARLNMGDCFSYAIAKVSGTPLLFIGDDFSRTDLLSA